MRSSSSNLYSFNGLSSSSYKNPITSPSSSTYSPSSTSSSPYFSFSSSRFSSSSITPSSPSPLVSSSSSFLTDSPSRKLSSIADYGSGPSSSFDSRLASRRGSSTDPRSLTQQPPTRATRTSETDNLLELYGVRGRGGATGTEQTKRKSSNVLEDRKKLGVLEEDSPVRFRRGSREGLFDGPSGSNRELLLGTVGRVASEGGRYADFLGGPGGSGGGGGGPSTSTGGGGSLSGDMNQIEYTNRLMEAHRKVDDLLRRRGLSAEDERKYLRAWEEIPVVREVRNDNYLRCRRSNSSDSGLSTDSDEVKVLPTVEIEADEDWEVDEFDEDFASIDLPFSPKEFVSFDTTAISESRTECRQTIQRRPEAAAARRIMVQPGRSKAAAAATFAAPSPLKEIYVEKVMKKRIHKEGVLKSLSLPKRTRQVAEMTIAMVAAALSSKPVVIKKNEKSCVFRAPSRSSIKRENKEDKKEANGLVEKVPIRRVRPATTGATPAPEPTVEPRPVLRRARKPSTEGGLEKTPAPSPRPLHPVEACKTLLATLRPRRAPLARSSAEISVQHCSFFQTTRTVVPSRLPEKHVRINLRLTERAPTREKAKIVLACARIAISRLDVNLNRPPLMRRRTIQVDSEPKTAEKRVIGKLERAMTIENDKPFVRQERIVKPLQIPSSFLEKNLEDDEPAREDFKAAREKLRKVPFVDCLTGLGLPFYLLDSPTSSIVSKMGKKKEEKKERLIDRIMKKEKIPETVKEEKEKGKLKRQNAFKKKRKRSEGDSAESSTSSSVRLNSKRCSARRATARDSDGSRPPGDKKTPSSDPPIAHPLPIPSSIPSLHLNKDGHRPSNHSTYPLSPISTILNASDRALIDSFRSSLSIPKPAALRRPLTPTPLDSAAQAAAAARLRDYKAPDPPATFVRRKTPPRK